MWYILIAVAMLLAAGALLWLWRKRKKQDERRRRVAELNARFSQDVLVMRAIEDETARLREQILEKNRSEHMVFVTASINITVSREWICNYRLERYNRPELSGGEVVVVRNLIAEEVCRRTRRTMCADPPAKDCDILVISDHGWVEYNARNGNCKEKTN